MSFNKYVVAIGVALSFLMASLNAAEENIQNPLDTVCNNMPKIYSGGEDAFAAATGKSQRKHCGAVSGCAMIEKIGKCVINCTTISEEAPCKKEGRCQWNTTDNLCKPNEVKYKAEKAAFARRSSDANSGADATPSETVSPTLPTAAACKAIGKTCKGAGVTADNADCADIRENCEAGGCSYSKKTSVRCLPPCRQHTTKASCTKTANVVCKWEDDACTYDSDTLTSYQ
jgi:hypothetical protein